MATVIAESLKSRFAELQAWREQNWAPAQREKNAGQRRKLVERFDPSAIAKAGDVLSPYVFADSDGAKSALDDLLVNGPRRARLLPLRHMPGLQHHAALL